jgi:hypothetical protein
MQRRKFSREFKMVGRSSPMRVPPSATSSTGRCFGASARIGRRSHVPKKTEEGRHRTEGDAAGDLR